MKQQTPSDIKQLHTVTITMAAAMVGVSARTVTRWISSGELPVLRHGRVVRVAPEALERFLTGRRAQ